MTTVVKTPAGSWIALIRKTGWLTTIKTFRTKRDAEDWARRTEDEIARCVYIRRAGSERTKAEVAGAIEATREMTVSHRNGIRSKQ